MKKLIRKFFLLCAVCLCLFCCTACAPVSGDPSGSASASGSASSDSSLADGSSDDDSGDATGGDEGENEGEKPDEPHDPTLTEQDFLRADGQVLRNERGEQVVLQGTNLGGWLHFEGWMDGGGGIAPDVWGNHYAVLTELGKRFTEEETETLLEIYQNAYIRQSDFDFLASLGLNFVRIPFFWTEIMDFSGNIRENAFDQLDWAVQMCKERGMYVLLDLHGTPGGHSGGWVTGGHTDSNELWTDETYQEWTVRIWQAIAERYRGEATVCGYGLLNEPVPPEGAEYADAERKMYDKLYRAVREVDPEHIVVMGAFYNFDQLGSPHVNGWQNVVYETHHYDDADKSAENQNNFMAGQLAYIQNYKIKWNVPVLAGEFNFWSAENAWRSWLYSLTAEGVPWCNWTYKNTAQDPALNWGLYHMPAAESVNYQSDDFDTIARKWAGYATENYTKNDFLCNILRDAAQYGWDRTDGIILDTSGYTATAYTGSTEGHPLSDILDGDLTSYWTSSEAQSGDRTQWVEVELGGTVSLNRVDIFCPHTDFMRGYAVYIYADGEWTEVGNGVGFAGNISVRFDEVATTKLRIVQTGDHAAWWRIYEIFTYLENTDTMS